MNIANFLTLLRLCMIPLAAYMFSLDAFGAAAVVFFAACLTDILDGYIARRFSMVTDIGKLLDPLADKGMQLTVLISLAICDRMPFLAVGVILAKECMMFLGGLFLYRKKIVVAANWYGKMATVVTSFSVMSLLLFYEKMSAFWRGFAEWLPVCVATLAFILYFHSFLRTVREGKLI